MKSQTLFFIKPGSGVFRIILSVTLALWMISAAALIWLIRLLELISRPEGAALAFVLVAMVVFAYSTVSGAAGLAILSLMKSYGRGYPKNYVLRRASRRSLYRGYLTGSLVGCGVGHRYAQSRYYGIPLYLSVDSASCPVAL